MENIQNKHKWLNPRQNRRIKMVAVACRLPGDVVDLLRDEAAERGIGITHIVAEAVVRGRPDLPWPEEVGRPAPTTGP